MTTMIAELYDALKDAGATEAKARAAAEAVASYEDRLNRIERHLVLMQWQLGAIAVLLLPSLWLLLRVASKVGALG
jgi:hypothetical protein